jgi:hypothetical protein
MGLLYVQLAIDNYYLIRRELHSLQMAISLFVIPETAVSKYSAGYN